MSWAAGKRCLDPSYIWERNQSCEAGGTICEVCWIFVAAKFAVMMLVYYCHGELRLGNIYPYLIDGGVLKTERP